VCQSRIFSLPYRLFIPPSTSFIFAGPEPVSIVQTVLCYVSPTPWNCVKEQAGRMLNVWEAELEESRHNLMGELQ
jgi:hypothetical protein